jgi:hypothetical protein
MGHQHQSYSANDPNEKPADGALLVAKYDKGHYVYTGLSFFRELPAGVPGAFDLRAIFTDPNQHTI